MNFAEETSMLSRLLRTWSPELLRPVIRLMLRFRITPNQVTLAGLALAALAGTLIAIGSLPLAAAILLVAGIFDALDALHRLKCDKKWTRALNPPGVREQLSTQNRKMERETQIIARTFIFVAYDV